MTNQSTSILSASICMMIAAEGAGAAVIHVPADQPTIQAGIDAAVDGDEVVIADGVYSGPGNFNIEFNGKAITVRSANGPENCIVDARQQGRCVVFQPIDGREAVLDGVTLTHGVGAPIGGPPFQFPMGGGMLCSGSPTIRRCIFRDNSFAGSGGGMVVLGSPLVTDCQFLDHVCGSGAAVLLVFQGAPLFERCEFRDNTAGAGACVKVFEGFDLLAVFRHCLFMNNTAQRGTVASGDHPGGGEFFENCLMAGNVATNRGVIADNINCLFRFDQCTMVDNLSMQGGLIDAYAFGQVEIRQSIVWRNTGKLFTSLGQVQPPWSTSFNLLIIVSNIEGGWSGLGGGNINVDPQFVNAAQGNFRLKPTSPCVDAGDNALVPVSLATDLDGYPRILDGDIPPDGVATVDMGCYEFIRSRFQINPPPAP